MFLQHDILQVIYYIQNFPEHAPVKLFLILHDRRTKQQVDGFIKHSVCACARVCVGQSHASLCKRLYQSSKLFILKTFFLIKLHKKHKWTHTGWAVQP